MEASVPMSHPHKLMTPKQTLRQLSLTASCPLEQKQNKQNSQKTQKAIGDRFAKGQPVLGKH